MSTGEDSKKEKKTSDVVISLGKKALPAKRKITRRKAGTTSKKYFTDLTQDAIIAYQGAENLREKELIYVQKILPAFESLVENLINVYGFKVIYDSKKDLKAECLEFLYTTVNKFDATRGSKAFSYFNVVAKHWLTIKAKQSDKKYKQHVSLDHKEAISQTDMETIEQFKVLLPYDEVTTTMEMRSLIHKILDELSKRVKTENELRTISAIKLIANTLDDVDFLNKRALLVYVREITGLTSKQLSICLSSLKKHYKELKKLDEFNH